MNPARPNKIASGLWPSQTQASRSFRAIIFFATIFTLQLMIVTWANGQAADWLPERLRLSASNLLSPGVRVEVGDVSTLQPIPKTASILLVSPNPPLGLVSFSANWLEEGTFRSTHGTALVHAYARVAVVKTPIRPGDPFSEFNITFQEREIGPYSQTGFFLSWEQLKQVRARGFAHPGMVLGMANAEMPLPVRQGELVDLINQKGSLKIVAKVKALENGQLDQRIRVQNPSTNKILYARVSGPGELQLR